MENAALQTRAVECQQIALEISLRDYFAGQALAGIMSLEEAYENVSESSIAAQAFAQADRMVEYAVAEPSQLPTRGQLAMAAMQGMLAAGDETPLCVIAAEAVRCADAMLVELKANGGAASHIESLESRVQKLTSALKEAHRVLMESHQATGELHWVSPGETLLEFLGNVIEDAGGAA